MTKKPAFSQIQGIQGSHSIQRLVPHALESQRHLTDQMILSGRSINNSRNSAIGQQCTAMSERSSKTRFTYHNLPSNQYKTCLPRRLHIVARYRMQDHPFLDRLGNTITCMYLIMGICLPVM